jgi:tetratricopeptide (TPR) repeat protein
MSTTVGASNYGNLFYHFMQEGIAWRITPFTFPNNQPMNTVCDTEKMYENMMNKYSYGNLKQPDLYIDETTMRMCYTHRRWFANLITNLVKEGDYDKALKALEKCETEIPSYNVPHSVDGSSLDLADAYIACNQPEKAVVILEQVEKRLREYVNWYLALSNTYFANSTRDCHRFIYILASIQETYNKLSTSKAKKASEYGKKAQQMDGELQKLYSAFITRCDNLGIQVQ